jgi:hypothetical protein
MKLKLATSTAVRAVRKTLGGVLRRIFDDAEDARYRHVQREIQHLIAQSGGHWSDEMERRVAQCLMRNSNC